MKDYYKIQTTDEKAYTERLIDKQLIWWKKVIDVQVPYRWNLQRLKPGFTLDIGCGIGRNLINLKGNGIGIDHNFDSVEIARLRGLKAFTVEEFSNCSFNQPEIFDSILLSHVAEHMTQEEVINLLKQYLPLLKLTGKIIIITPQEVGYASDSTHVEFVDFLKIRNIIQQINFQIIKEYSFPFPRFLGNLFKYNEFVSISCKL